jgi:PadR family transcriptional regulator, regulatory protein PadR
MFYILGVGDKTMKFLSRSEEFIIIAIWRLKANAYVVTIREELKKMTGETWAVGALFVSLDRMTGKGYLESRFSASTATRGGRAKRLYRLTPAAVEALNAVREIEATVRQDIPLVSKEESA